MNQLERDYLNIQAKVVSAKLMLGAWLVAEVGRSYDREHLPQMGLMQAKRRIILITSICTTTYEQEFFAGPWVDGEGPDDASVDHEAINAALDAWEKEHP